MSIENHQIMCGKRGKNSSQPINSMFIGEEQVIELKSYYPYFGVQPFTFPSKHFATLQKGRGSFL
jgi:hypothetical protein